MLSESVRSEVRVGAHFLVVVHTEGNDVFVGSQKVIARDRANSLAGLAPQHRLELLRNDRSAEHPGHRIADGHLEFALDALNQPSLAAHAQTPDPPVCSPHTGPGSGVSHY